jgi:acyl transferase domain-containing protein/short-subunit dehydrogenase
MDGKFPKADNINEFWENLRAGRDCIDEVPESRFSYDEIYEPRSKQLGKINSKWGGFIDSMEEFDAEFFGYSPIEASIIDPQERLFLETTWNTMENSGYTRNTLRNEKVGVFVGVSYGYYQFLSAQMDDNEINAVSSYSSIANRVSYFFDLKGPSMAVDTMCSSSGTAIHLACESIWRGESSLAFAGGVNLTIGPWKYQVLSSKNYLSSDGRCRSFGEGGDGYVPGEGVGCILLKPLKKAIEDGNHIEAVILSTGINHGGKSTGYSVPNPAAQADLIRRTIEKANVDANDISYIETHGTGTPLGDPIEIQGLLKGLNIDEKSDLNIKIGSVKSNVGHLESAAAVTALIKVIMQMKHNEIVPSLHSQTTNKNIKFDSLPFDVVQNNQIWNEKKLENYPDLGLCSTVSSFGAGGSNACIVLAKYIDECKGEDIKRDNIVPISARNSESLKENAKKILDYINATEQINLIDICYTLQAGREEMPERAAFVVEGIKDLKDKLSLFIEGYDGHDLHTSSTRIKANANTDMKMSEKIKSAIEENKLSDVAKAWCEGEKVEWSYIFQNYNSCLRLIALPTYSFQKNRYWIEDLNDTKENNIKRKISHSMVDFNLSTIYRQLYKKDLTGKEKYFSDHVVNDRIMMPGAAMLEMARTTSSMAVEGIGNIVGLKDITFEKALIYGKKDIPVYVEVFPNKSSLFFELKTKQDEGEIILCSGTAIYKRKEKGTVRSSNPYDESLFEGKKVIKKDEIYSLLKKGGFTYGKYYQTIEKICLSDKNTVAAKLVLQNDLHSQNSEYVLKPSLIDGALQTVSMFFESPEEGNEYLPYNISEILILAELTASCTVVTRKIKNADNKFVFNISVINDKGLEAAAINGYTLVKTAVAPKTEEKQNIIKKTSDTDLRNKVRMFVCDAISKETGTKTESISEIDSFEKYGIDSVISMRITDRLREAYSDIPTTILYDVKEVGMLVDYLISEFSDITKRVFDEDVEENIISNNNEQDDSSDRINIKAVNSKKKYKGYFNVSEDIAIIGVDGRFPKSDTLDEFWDNLVNARDCIEEIPSDRWDYRKLYSPDKNAKGKIYSKWGGFINGADKFDAEFFGIIPLQAMIMDPQERIFLETAWHCVEDSGYSIKNLENYKVGVYTGEMWGGYQKIGVEETLKGNTVSLSSSFASTSNKVSYIMNLHGPSMTVDTMCSSSLTSIHLACNALNDYSIDAAIAGGVNLTLHSDKYLSLSQGKFLSADGRCRAFGEGGSGYVPGEGVGAVMLKRLSDAERDGDHIYAVIKGTSINHGGRSNAYFVPNVEEQKNLILDALEKSGLSPRTISSVEAHGTGTALGDPIEVAGFTKAYGTYTDDKQYCSLGSVKSNIGHCESAAGIAAVIKVILEIKNKKLVPSIHSDVLNTKIDFEASPFHVQHKYEDWKRPLILENGNYAEYPRRAAISAFGAGGTNVHVILEEYDSEINERNYGTKKRMFLFSAKKKLQLNELMKSYAKYLDKLQPAGKDNENRILADLEGTLINGREKFTHRLAIIASSINELKQSIFNYLNQKEDIDVFSDEAKANSFENDIFDDEDGKSYLNSLINSCNYRKLCKLWAKGVEFDFADIFEDDYKKLNLPLYPFEKNLISIKRSEGDYKQCASLHSMVDQNVSTIRKQMFKKELSIEEFYLADHIVNGNNILPGVAYLEMVRASAELSINDGIVAKIKNVVWRKPLTVTDTAVTAYISLEPDGNHVNCEVKTINDLEIQNVFSTCEVELVRNNTNWVSKEYIQLDKYDNECKKCIESNEFYKKFSEIGFDYKDRMRGIEQIWVADDEKTAKVIVREQEGIVGKNEFNLHPAVMDAGIQAVAVTIAGENAAYLPYSVNEVEILGKTSEVKYIYINRVSQTEDTFSFDLIYTASDGKVIVKITGLTVKRQHIAENKGEIHYYTTEIVQANIAKNTISEKQRVIVFDDNASLSSMLERMNTEVVFVKPGSSYSKVSNNEYVCNCKDEQSCTGLFRDIKANGTISAIVVKADSIREDERNNQYAEKMFCLMKSIILSGMAQTVNILHVFDGVVRPDGDNVIKPEYLAVAGLFKTAAAEYNKIKCKNIAVNGTVYNQVATLCSIIFNELAFSNDKVEESYFSDETRKHIRAMTEIKNPEITGSSVVIENAAYIISGGLQGVGYIFAEYFVNKYKASVILLGRSKLNAEGQDKLTRLNSSGEKAVYYSVDVNDADGINSCIKEVLRKGKEIKGIIHAAGVKKDEIIVNKSAVTFRNTIAPKTNGLENLYNAVKECNYDFFIAFSSIAGLMGNVGQADYSYGNNYMDAFAYGKKGKIISINWPYWLNGGMTLSAEDMDNMKKRNGLLPLSTKDGIDAFEFIVRNVDKYSNVLVLPTVEKIMEESAPKETVKTESKPKTVRTASSTVNKIEDSPVKKAEIYIKDIISDETKIDIFKIETDTHFDSFGLDSVMTMNMTARLDSDFKGITKTLFYETHSVSELIIYLQENYPNEFEDLFASEASQDEKVYYEETAQEREVYEREAIIFDDLINSNNVICNNSENGKPEEFAIIGLELKVPEADSIKEFWDNIVSGRNCIKEIPKDRFDIDKYYEKERGSIGKTYGRLGGFINAVEQFDPLFFNMAPNSAAFVDPLERLLLEAVWHLFEDAGIVVSEMKDRDVGVFIGAMWQQYQMLLMNGPGQGMIPSLFSNLSNRLSSFYDLHGPSMTVDTMCSSSLTALKLAINSIRNDECSSAIVGGINLSLHPSKFINLSQGGLLSDGERCIPFAEGAKGYLPSEGLGLVMIKPLTQAKKDGDNIRMVIKSDTIVHSGKGGGFMVPNSEKQSEVIKKAIIKAGIPCNTIGYIESQGICTEVGDAIEFKAVREAFSDLTQEKDFCSIGSAKYVIGHTEAASGVIALIKIAMQMKHHIIPGILASETINKEIKLDGTPFNIPRQNIEWNNKYENNVKIPLRAGINGFGGGGTYLHFILEEYIDMDARRKKAGNREQAFTISAKTLRSLKKSAANLVWYIENNAESEDKTEALLQIISEIAEIDKKHLNENTLLSELNFNTNEYLKLQDYLRERLDEKVRFAELTKLVKVNELVNLVSNGSFSNSTGLLENIAFTLQTAREVFKQKVVFIAENIEELLKALKEYINSDNDETVIFCNGKNQIENNTLRKCVELWTSNAHASWKDYYPEETAILTDVPGYAFDNERYWIPNEFVVDCCSVSEEIGEGSIRTKDYKTEYCLNNSAIECKKRISHIISDVIGIPEGSIEYDVNLPEYGLDSFLAQRLFQEISAISDEPILFSMFENEITVDSIYEKVFVKSIESSDKNEPEVKQPGTLYILARLERGEISVEEAINMEEANE